MNRPAGKAGPERERRTWRRSRDEAPAHDSGIPLVAALGHRPPADADERGEALAAALQLAAANADHGLLIPLLALDDPASRIAVLAVVLRVADELSPRFGDLMAALRDDERMFVLGALLEGTRLDPVPERRLLRHRLVWAAPVRGALAGILLLLLASCGSTAGAPPQIGNFEGARRRR